MESIILRFHDLTLHFSAPYLKNEKHGRLNILLFHAYLNLNMPTCNAVSSDTHIYK